MSTPRDLWLDRTVPEASVVSLCEAAGWTREHDRPRTLLGSRLLQLAPPRGSGSSARITLEAFVHDGCQVVTLRGDPSESTAALWAQLEALPRYERHAEDASAAEPARRLRGLRQWAVIAVRARSREPGLEAAIERARADGDPVVRACGEDLARLLADAPAPNEG